MEILILLTLLGIVWLISSKRWRRFLTPFSVVILLCALFATPIGVAVATRGLMLGIQPDSGESAQATVVLGRGPDLLPRRIEVVEKLWRAQRSPMIFASGMSDADQIIEQLQNNGIPGKALSGERCSQSTEENALFTSAVLYPKQVRKIILVTDEPHLLRSVWLFQNSGFTVIPHGIPLPPQWSPQRQSLLLAREYMGLLQYAFTNRFKQRSVEELITPPAAVTHKLVDWNCQLSGVKATK